MPPKAGFYTATIEMDGRNIPYVVYALSDFMAAKQVRDETGIRLTPHDLMGPYAQIPF